MLCKLCQKFYKKYPPKKVNDGFGIHWQHKISKHFSYWSKVECAFDKRGNFTSKNWACETMGKLRELANKYGYVERYNDSSIGVLPLVDDVEYGFLVMTWYKDRGKTGSALIMEDDNVGYLTKKIAEKIIKNQNKFKQLNKKYDQNQ